MSVPFAQFSATSFQKELCVFLEQASTESIKKFAAQTTKAGSNAFESRETVDPAIITELLMTLLEAIGKRVPPAVLAKRVRDEVYWENGAEKPWRRSPIWLVLRVGLLSYFHRVFGQRVARVHYKFILCVMLAQLLDETYEDLSPEIVAFQVAKLSRRAAKLQGERETVDPEIRGTYDMLFGICRPLLQKSIRRAKFHVDKIWDNFKAHERARRPVESLPRLADPNSLVLSLRNSRTYVQEALRHHNQKQNGSTDWVQSNRSRIDPTTTSNGSFSLFTSRYFKLFRAEESIDAKLSVDPPLVSSHEQRCIELATQIEAYAASARDMAFGNPEQNSMMLLTLMRLWTTMDRSATKAFSLLHDYDTGFPPEVLDVLHIASLRNMHVLFEIQRNLITRRQRAKYRNLTIFSDPCDGCFAQSFYDQSDSEGEMPSLHKKIIAASNDAREQKSKEWERLSSEFERLHKRIAESTCLMTTEEYGIHHDKDRCPKCYLQRRAKRMRIQVHEDFLPRDTVQAKAAVFELACPTAFTAYRNATWLLMSTLALPRPGKGTKAVGLLPDYPSLRPFHRAEPSKLVLASSTKSWLSMHNKIVKLPTSIDRICLPNGFKLEYHDPVAGIWPGQISQRLSFANHCQCVLPSSSPLAYLQFSPSFSVEHVGPTSYQIIAAQTQVPLGVNIHEFNALQTLRSGRHRRWPQILMELASTNLNFSTEVTCVLIAQVALQAGPSHESDVRRLVHRTLRDKDFCLALSDQLNQRLEAIRFSWREAVCMESLITIILRLVSLAESSCRSTSVDLLVKARQITLEWMMKLQSEIRTVVSAGDARTCSGYAFWAAVLCKRTFSLYVEDNEDLMSLDNFDHIDNSEPNGASDEIFHPHRNGTAPTLSAEDLRCFIIASITLQDNLPGDPTKLQPLLQNALIRDLRMVFSLRQSLRKSISHHPESFAIAIDKLWPCDAGSTRIFSTPEISNNYWVRSITSATSLGHSQIVFYHLLEGYLLIDGKPLGKLPSEYLDSIVLKELFGNQNLLTYPSHLPGMSYSLAFVTNQHQIHMGRRQGALVVQAMHKGRLLELVPHDIFCHNATFDLPAPLVQDCVHWLDLQTGILEARRRPDIWKTKSGNWQVDFPNCTGWRRNSILVDPYSQVFRRIANIFDNFEEANQIVVTQPRKGSPQIELRRLELSFFINAKRLLECKELKSEIDPNQDAGTWYGLACKIILRDSINVRERSIIVPMGELTFARKDCHVTTFAANEGIYARFHINTTLGRLECPTEPTLMYLKALFHAYTSFIVPDPLTGRTGSEEALSSLQSCQAQPWSPLNPKPQKILATIANLTPKRSYYPASLKVMQQVSWNPHLTVTIQQESFRPIVDRILGVSQQLSAFSTVAANTISLSPDGDWRLRIRHMSRYELYIRANNSDQISDATSNVDSMYVAGEHEGDTIPRRNHVSEIVGMIRGRSDLTSAPNVAGLLQSWPVIGGFDRQFDKILLSDRLDCEIALEWGPLVNLCRSVETAKLEQILFLFAILAFRSDVDMNSLRVLVAIALTKELQTIETPKWPSFVRFRYNHIPTSAYLAEVIDSCRVPYPGDERQISGFRIDYSQRRKLEAAQIAHEQATQADCETLAGHFVLQWPHSNPKIDGLDRPLLLDVPQALELLHDEWSRLLQNLDLSQYLGRLQAVLNLRVGNSHPGLPFYETLPEKISFTTSTRMILPTLSYDLLREDMTVNEGNSRDEFEYAKTKALPDRASQPAASHQKKENTPFYSQRSTYEKRPAAKVSSEMREMESVLSRLLANDSNVRQRYGRDLMQSLIAFKGLQAEVKDCLHKPISLFEVGQEIDLVRNHAQETFNIIVADCGKNDPRKAWLVGGNLWPVITPITLLEQLRSSGSTRLSSGMKNLLIAYALAITNLQKLLRLQDALLRGNHQGVQDERSNPGHENWQPTTYTDWLLLEIESNILVRKDQVDVALATISPASRSNSVLQMNMGQGRSKSVLPSLLEHDIVSEPIFAFTYWIFRLTADVYVS